MFSRSDNSMLAIDLAPDAIRVLDVTVRHGLPSVSAIASGVPEPGGLETLPERQLKALETLLGTHKMRSRRCVAAVPTSLVTTRSVMIDPAKPLSPEDQIKQTLQN